MREKVWVNKETEQYKGRNKRELETEIEKELERRKDAIPKQKDLAMERV